jgi:hypothetical protein
MPARKPPDPDAKPQIEKFREMARELECVDDEETFWAKVVRVARHKPKSVEPASKKKGMSE